MGKLGIILAFLLSVVAAGGSYYLYQGWVEARTVRGVVEAKYDQVKEKMITVQSEKEQVAAENAKLSAKSEEYRAKTDAMQLQVKKLQVDQSRVASEKTELQKKLEAEQQKIVELQTQMVELEQKAKDAQAACGVTPADLTLNPFSAQTVSNTPAPGIDAAEVEKAPLVFKPVVSGGSGTSVPPPSSSTTSTSRSDFKQEVQPASQTSSAATQTASALAVLETTTGPKVLTVNRKFNFVVVNLGMQDGLKMGDRLKVFKQGQQCATVQVEKLYDKFSAATLVEENPKQQVVEGDEISRA
ncbi:MAG: hypothetical protein V1882_00075 [Candidatus Omnitrophota bacterium]